MTSGILRSIWISSAACQSLQSVAEIRAIPGRGLDGDRYSMECGTFSHWPGGGRAVSLIAEETLDAVLVERGIDLREGRSRRNLITFGIALDELQDRTFRIGTAVFRGIRPCPPCSHLEQLTERGVLDALKDRGGFRADVIAEGVLHVGDAIELIAIG